MYQLGDRVMYSTTGVCEIVEIKKQKVLDMDMEYYVLNPLYQKNSTIMAPVKNADNLMRELTQKDEVDKILSSMDSIEIQWIEDDKQRAEHFRDRIKTREVVEWMKVIKNILIQQQQRQSEGRRLRQSDENVLKTVQKLVNEEFATSLCIDIENVGEYIRKNIKTCG